MKKNTYCFILSAFVAMHFVFSAKAQVLTRGNVFINDTGLMYLHSGSLNFGSQGFNITSRTSAINGKFSVGNSIVFNSESNLNHIDGYVKFSRTTSIQLPLGDELVLAPLKLTPQLSNSIEAAYWRKDPSNQIGGMLDGSIGVISDKEFWEIIGPLNFGQITLSWNVEADLGTFLNSDLSRLTIAGWDGSKWVQLVSTVDSTSIFGSVSDFTKGSITTNIYEDLSIYRYFTLAQKGDCEPLIPSSGIVKTWNGSSWSPSTPTVYDPVVINATYNGNLSCNSLTLNADISLSNGEYVEVVNGVSGSGKIFMSSQASFVQRNSSATAPNIELTKQTRLLKAFDYVYWGTPIAGNFFSQLNGAQATTSMATGAFDLKYRYQSGPGGGWQNLSSIITGSGYIMRVKPGVAPYFNSTTLTDRINLKFTGTANNGFINVPVSYNSSSPNGATSHNLLANPYPSAIDGDMFLKLNPDIDGVIYVWQQSTPPGNSLATTYTQADYLAYTRAGFVAPSATGTFDGKIASGQGFKVKALSNSSVTFTNCMRLTGSNSSFYKETPYLANSGNPIDRFKITLSKNDGSVYSQILIAYMEEATIDYDRMYDAGRNSVSTTQLFSMIPSDNRRLAINARPLFFAEDVVPIGVSKNNNDTEQLVLTLSHKEGIFNDGSISIYLKDKYTNELIDLSSPVDITINSTLLNDKYEIVYLDNTLNNNQITDVINSAFIKNQQIYLTSSLPMKEVRVYDLNGKMIRLIKAGNQLTLNEPFNFADSIYLIKVKLENDRWYTHKLINHN